MSSLRREVAKAKRRSGDTKSCASAKDLETAQMDKYPMKPVEVEARKKEQYVTSRYDLYGDPLYTTIVKEYNQVKNNQVKTGAFEDEGLEDIKDLLMIDDIFYEEGTQDRFARVIGHVLIEREQTRQLLEEMQKRIEDLEEALMTKKVMGEEEEGYSPEEGVNEPEEWVDEPEEGVKEPEEGAIELEEGVAVDKARTPYIMTMAQPEKRITKEDLRLGREQPIGVMACYLRQLGQAGGLKDVDWCRFFDETALDQLDLMLPTWKTLNPIYVLPTFLQHYKTQKALEHSSRTDLEEKMTGITGWEQWTGFNMLEIHNNWTNPIMDIAVDYNVKDLKVTEGRETLTVVKRILKQWKSRKTNKLVGVVLDKVMEMIEIGRAHV